MTKWQVREIVLQAFEFGLGSFRGIGLRDETMQRRHAFDRKQSSHLAVKVLFISLAENRGIGLFNGFMLIE